MNFEDLIEQLSLLFYEHRFDVIERSTNYIRFESDSVTVTIAYDSRENWLYIRAGRKNGFIGELSSDVLRDVFDEDAKNQTIQDIMSFFKGKGAKILYGDSELLDELESYTQRRSKEFTEQIVKLQHLQSADFAWQSKDYKKFIECLEFIDKTTLQDSYKKKYEIALKKLKQL